MTWMTIIKLALLVYVGFGLFLYFAQRSLMYFPVPENTAEYPAETIEVQGAVLKVWVVNPGRRDALLYFGGNAEDVYFNAPHFEMHMPQHTVYLINYRGYGGSSGSPTEEALTADALRLHAILSKRHDRIGIIGRSLGSAVAVFLAARQDIDRLALVTPFDSASAVAQHLYPMFPVRWLLRDRYDSMSQARQVSAPTLIVIAEHDRVVPPRHAHRLAESFETVVPSVQILPGAGHNGLSLNAAYWGTLARFFNPES